MQTNSESPPAATDLRWLLYQHIFSPVFYSCRHITFPAVIQDPDATERCCFFVISWCFYEVTVSAVILTLTTTREMKYLKGVRKTKRCCSVNLLSVYTAFLSVPPRFSSSSLRLFFICSPPPSFSHSLLPPFSVSFRPDSLALTLKWIVKHFT